MQEPIHLQARLSRFKTLLEVFHRLSALKMILMCMHAVLDLTQTSMNGLMEFHISIAAPLARVSMSRRILSQRLIHFPWDMCHG